MARTQLPVQTITPAGLAPSYTAGDAANGHAFSGNTGDCFILVRNTSGSACTVTIETPAKFKGLALVPPAVVVPATNGERQIGPFDPSLYQQQDGNVYIDLSTASGVTLGVFFLPAP